jgi:hypothetical protein
MRKTVAASEQDVLDLAAPNAAVLFHRVNGTWQYVTYGSYWDCVGVNGVPPEAAAMFAGCYQN